jgi:dTDP-4-dehydrorhamnose 3,5-epimerase-like enzyme
MKDVEIINLKDYGDKRGALFSVSETDIVFLDTIENIHFGKIRPNSIRGNHFHDQRKEILIIAYSDRWTLAWAKKESSETTQKSFKGSGAVLIKIDSEIAHTVKNDGKKDLEIISLSDRIFSKEAPDTFSKILME